MKRLLLFICLFLPAAGIYAQAGYSIDITLKPYKNTWIYLGHHYGPKKALADSVLLDANSKGTFKGAQALPGGIYFVVSPRKEILFELLIDKQQTFSIQADTSNLPDGVVFTNSPDNTLFKNYTSFASTTGQAAANLNAQLASAKSAKDSAAITPRLRQLSEKLQTHRDSLAKKYPSSILTALFNAMKEPVVPPASKHPGGKYDSMYAYQYYKAHYWDGVEFDDERLVRTPFFEPKLIRYYRELVPPNPDSIIKEVDRMVLYSRGSKEMYKYFMVHFVQKYVNPEFMGQDAVFVHLFEKYINTGQTDFFTPQYKDFMTKRAYSIMANLIGRPAANLEMVDTSGKPRPLYGIKSDMVVVCFWDPTCGHCKETVPRLDSMYKVKWKNQGVTLYGVMTDGGKENWTKFIKDHNLKDWVHVYQLPSKEVEDNAAGRPSYKQLYDVYQTPLLYLLDKDKRIVAKKLSFEQLDEVISLKLKQSTSR
jgi:thiol-disulfide isomerase/thioredoxin